MSPRLSAFRRAPILAFVGLVLLAALLSGATAAFAAAGDPSGGATDSASDSASDPASDSASVSGSDSGRGPGRTVEILPIDGLIDPPVAAAIIDVIDQAQANDSELVLLQISTPGAVSADQRELIEAIRTSTVPVVVYVGPRGADGEAAGLGTLIALAAPVLAMAEDATLGPASPADLGDDPGTSDEKAQVADLLAARGAGAGSGGDGLVGLLTGETDAAGGASSTPVTVDTLRELGLEPLTAAGLEPLLVELDGREVTTADGATATLRIRRDENTVRFHSLGLIRRALHAATTPVFIYVLLIAGLGMLLFEVFQPGFGVAGVAGIVTAGISVFGVSVLPVHWWAVALVVGGLVLFAIDVAIAGFGVVTALATVSFAVGSLFFYDSDSLGISGWLVAATTITAVVFFVIIMTEVLRAQAGPDDTAVEDLVGRPGIVRSVLNPEGHVYIDGALWRARWTGDAKRAKVGTPVRVHAVEGALVLVEAFTPDPLEAEQVAAEQ